MAELQQYRDYYLEKGRVVFTESYLVKRGSCCGSTHCRHCPYTPSEKGNPELKKNIQK